MLVKQAGLPKHAHQSRHLLRQLRIQLLGGVLVHAATWRRCSASREVNTIVIVRQVVMLARTDTRESGPPDHTA